MLLSTPWQISSEAGHPHRQGGRQVGGCSHAKSLRCNSCTWGMAEQQGRAQGGADMQMAVAAQSLRGGRQPPSVVASRLPRISCSQSQKQEHAASGSGASRRALGTCVISAIPVQHPLAKLHLLPPTAASRPTPHLPSLQVAVGVARQCGRGRVQINLQHHGSECQFS